MKETELRAINQINEAVFDKVKPWISLNVQPPIIKVIEICRATKLAPESVLNALGKANSMVIPVELDGKEPEKWKDKYKTPQSSKMADRIKSEIQAEGQRYQRRFQYPISPTPRTTTKKSDKRVVNWQVGRISVRLKTRDDPPFVYGTNKKQGDKQARKALMAELEDGSNLFSREKRKRASTQAQKLIDILNSLSVMPMQRPAKIKEMCVNAFLTEDPVIVLNWICPPGTSLCIAPDSSGIFRSYIGLDPKDGFEKDYRLSARLDLERRLVRAFERCEIPLWYIKLVADDNPYCLYPYSIVRDGEWETMTSIADYAKYVQGRLDLEIGKDKITVLTSSEFLGKERFRGLIQRFSTTKDDIFPFLPTNIKDIEKDVIIKHTGLDVSLLPWLESFVERVIRQYSQEGLIIREMLGDNVIVAWNESTRRVSTIDAVLKMKGLSTFPKIFVLHEIVRQEIKDNY